VVARGPERLLASDEGGELAAARQSAIHNCTMTGSHSPTAGARRGGCARTGALLASDEGGEFAAARQTPIHNSTMTGSHSPRER
jgi:hypothetical protein